MTINIPGQHIGDVLTGASAVLAVIAVGALLFSVMRRFPGRFPFIRLGLVIALAPLSLYNVLDRSEGIALLFFAMIITLLGVSMDGISAVLMPDRPMAAQDPEKKKKEVGESQPDSLAPMMAAKAFILLTITFSIILTVLLITVVGMPDPHVTPIAAERGTEKSKPASDSNPVSAVQIPHKNNSLKTEESTVPETVPVLSCDRESTIRTPDKNVSSITEENTIAETSPSAHTNLAPTLEISIENVYFITGDPSAPRIVAVNNSNGVSSVSAPICDEQSATAACGTPEIILVPEGSSNLISALSIPIRHVNLIEGDRTAPESALIPVDQNNWTGMFHKVMSVMMLECMEGEVFREDITELRIFIENNCKTSP